MAEFSVGLRMIGTGSLIIELADGKTRYTLDPWGRWNSLGPQELVLCLINVIAGKKLASMVWNSEYGDRYFEFKTENGLTVFQAHESLTKAKIHFEVEMPSFDLVLVFWRSLRCFQAQFLDNEFQQAWGYPFPDTELAKLTEQLREIKRKQK